MRRIWPLLAVLVAVPLVFPSSGRADAPTESGSELDAPHAVPPEPPGGQTPAVPPGYDRALPDRGGAPADGSGEPATYPAPGEPVEWKQVEKPEVERHNVVTGDLFAQALHYERALAERVGAYVGLRAFAFLVVAGVRDDETLAVGAEAGFRFFMAGDAPEGFWIAPQAGAGVVSTESSFGTERGIGWWAGGLLGYTWLFSSGFVLSAGGGAEYVDLEVSSSDGPVGIRRVGSIFRLALGWAF